MERLIRWVAPQLALRRELARMQLSRVTEVTRRYQAASPSHMRQTPAASGSGNEAMDHARLKLADWGRHLDENHDMTSGALSLLSQMVAMQRLVPMLKDRSGRHLEDQSLQLAELWEVWGAQADYSEEMHWDQLSLLIARTWFRDGEAWKVHFLGSGDQPGPVPYSLRAYEPEYVPWDSLGQITPSGRRTVHGVELDDKDRRRAVHFYRSHPSDTIEQIGPDTVRIPIERVTQVRTTRRLGQLRGVSVLAPAVTRIADVFDYEQSEQFAAKVASAVCLQIVRDPSFAMDSAARNALTGATPFEAQSGMVFDGLKPGEKVEVIDTSRPNPELGVHRRQMLRAASAGIGVSYSSMAHDYDGSYSSQRQDLVESRQVLKVPQLQFRRQVLEPIYRRFIAALQLMPTQARMSFRGVDPSSLADFDLIPPETPWIQPLQEAKADSERIANRTESRHGIMRQRGARPERVDREIAADAMTTLPVMGEDDDEQDQQVRNDEQGIQG